MNAVVFGAGRIGRGFLGQLLFEGGYATTFVDADATIVDALHRRRNYPLRLVANGAVRELVIENVQAVHVRDEAAVSDAIARADLLVSSVGVANLPGIATPLAAGMHARAARTDETLDILLCENQRHAAALMRDLLRPHLLDLEDTERRLGLVETVVGRMVPAPPSGVDPLLLIAEPYRELPIARLGLRGPVPDLPGIFATDDFGAFEARKLFLHNGGHAALAYLGHERGHEFIWECAADPDVVRVCRAAISEASEALIKEYGFAPDALRAFCEDLMHRFANRELGDTVARVAADPLRKLRPDDRLLGASALCHKHGIRPAALEEVTAAARRYAASEESL